MSDVIKLDNHRLLCGNAQVKADVDKLLDGVQVDLLLTDPPYGINIVQTVKVRKHPVDIEKLKETLRNAKIETDYTNRILALKLNRPITTVEHWFRKDDSFSIPDEDIWLELKELLKIKTNEFDEAMTIFEEKEGVYEKANRYYLDNGIAPTLTQQQEKIITIGNYMPSNHDASRIVDNEGLAPTVKENHGTVTATNYGLRVRKLTPLECWRLQGFDDEDFYKAKEKLNSTFYKGKDKSNSQLYKQAGNSITVNVLEKIFLNLF